MNMTVSVSSEFRRPVEQVFDAATAPRAAPLFMVKLFPIPGVAAAEAEGGGTLRPGARRQVRLSDGSELVEEILAFDPPVRHRYRWATAPPFPFNLIVRGAESDWTFSGEGSSTHVQWAYEFELTTPLVYPVAKVALALFERWMRSSLVRLREVLAESRGP